MTTKSQVRHPYHLDKVPAMSVNLNPIASTPGSSFHGGCLQPGMPGVSRWARHHALGTGVLFSLRAPPGNNAWNETGNWN